MTHDTATPTTKDDMSTNGPDTSHPNYCSQCHVVHHEPLSDLDARVLNEREQRRQHRRTRRLIVAPHCDDEALGCGGLIAKHPQECHVVVLAEPDEVRRKEFDEAQGILGYSMATFLNLPDGYVGADMSGLVGQLDRLVAEIRPDEMYLPFPSLHQDHIAAYEAGMRAARLSMSAGHHFTPSVLCYDVAAYDVGLYPTELRWNTFEALSEAHIDAKVAAVDSYASQQVLTPHPANNIKHEAETIGAARQVHWAEQFALVRGVRA
jgi:LmbE family N-acetylglucosaminyl deacetylase